MAYDKTRVISAGWALGAALTLAGCAKVETMPKPEAGTRPVACTMEYAPVCAAKGNEHRTFSNACMAKADGYSVEKQGACEG